MISEQPARIPVAPGLVLEGQLAIPPGASAGVVVCHPHPLYGGDMDSAVVVATVQACAACGLATLRFNFRGTGSSGGRHDGGRGERADVAAALGLLADRLPASSRVALAGYSFGAAVAAAVAAKTTLPGLALIAPPGPIAEPTAVNGPLLVVYGSEDGYAREVDVPRATVRVIEGADHFFMGALDRLGETIQAWAAAVAA